MFKRSQKKKKNENTSYELIITPKLAAIFQINNLQELEPINLTEQQSDQLEQYLKLIVSSPELKTRFLKELDTTVSRELQLGETKEIVYSLRETDQTSDDALDFLKEKVDQLNIERENLIMIFFTLLEELKNSLLSDYPRKIEDLIISITFIDTDAWQKDLDYYRTRFLMQREQEEDQERKDKFKPLEDKVSAIYKDPIARTKEEVVEQLTKPSVRILLTKSQTKNIIPLIDPYNKLLNNLPDSQPIELLELNETEIQTKLSDQEKYNFVVGKEIYTLKREQGILTLKIYDIVQTLKSRLLNITGSIASRSFLVNGFKDLIKSVNDNFLSDTQKKEEVFKTITRLLRILGGLQPGEELQ